MAAIFGFANYSDEILQRLNAMAVSLAHRGSAEPKFFRSRSAAFGCRATTRQHSEYSAGEIGMADGSILVVLDGKIVNAEQLGDQLDSSNQRADRLNDVELIAALYRCYGEACFELLRGSFAVAIFDEERNRLVIARDHLGHKPIFFAETPDGFHFASESRALVHADVVPFAVDMQSLSHFLSLRFIPAPRSLIKGINKVPPAHYLIHERGKTSVRQFWQTSFATKMELDVHDVVDALDETMRDAIESYLPNSGVTGAFLSGGLDSGLIVANMSQAIGGPFSTFSLGVDDDSDEVPVARLVAKMYGTKNHEYYPRDDVVRLLPTMIWHLDEPSDMVLVSKFLLSKMATPHVDSVMSGDGGDELFAGFMRYLGVRDAQYFARFPAWIRNKAIRPIARQLGGQKGLKGLAGKILWLTEITAAGELPERYAAAVEYLRFRKADKQQLLSTSAWQSIDDVNSNQLLADKVRESDAEDPIEKLLHTDFQTRLPEHLLMLDDRTGAAHGVEVLCPLADKNLVEFACRIPADMKIRGRQGKFIERQLAEHKLPSEVVNLEKTGWSFPFADLCAGRLQPFLRSVFSDSRLVKEGIFEPAAIACLIDEHGTFKADHHIRIWMLLSLEIWYRMASEGLHFTDMDEWMDRHLADDR